MEQAVAGSSEGTVATAVKDNADCPQLDPAAAEGKTGAECHKAGSAHAKCISPPSAVVSFAPSGGKGTSLNKTAQEAACIRDVACIDSELSPISQERQSISTSPPCPSRLVAAHRAGIGSSTEASSPDLPTFVPKAHHALVLGPETCCSATMEAPLLNMAGKDGLPGVSRPEDNQWLALPGNAIPQDMSASSAELDLVKGTVDGAGNTPGKMSSVVQEAKANGGMAAQDRGQHQAAACAQELGFPTPKCQHNGHAASLDHGHARGQPGFSERISADQDTQAHLVSKRSTLPAMKDRVKRLRTMEKPLGNVVAVATSAHGGEATQAALQTPAECSLQSGGVADTPKNRTQAGPSRAEGGRRRGSRQGLTELTRPMLKPRQDPQTCKSAARARRSAHADASVLPLPAQRSMQQPSDKPTRCLKTTVLRKGVGGRKVIRGKVPTRSQHRSANTQGRPPKHRCVTIRAASGSAARVQERHPSATLLPADVKRVENVQYAAPLQSANAHIAEPKSDMDAAPTLKEQRNAKACVVLGSRLDGTQKDMLCRYGPNTLMWPVSSGRCLDA